MEANQYQGLWDKLSQPMKLVVEEIRNALLAKADFAGKFEFSPVTLETDTDEYFASLIINDIRGAEKRVVVAVEFKLRDEDNGANVTLQVDDVEDQSQVFSYIPCNYTDGVVTLDLAELEERITEVPFDQMFERTQELLRVLLEEPAQ